MSTPSPTRRVPCADCHGSGRVTRWWDLTERPVIRCPICLGEGVLTRPEEVPNPGMAT